MSKFSRQLVFTNSTITVDGTSVGSTYDIPFGTPNTSINELMEFMTITGSPTLTSSLTITTSGTPSCPITITFYSTAAINLNGNTVTIFGTSLTQEQASNPFVLTACYNGTTFTSVLNRVELPVGGLTNADLAEMPAYTVKMNSGAVSSHPIDATFPQFKHALGLGYDVEHIVISFNSGEQGGRNEMCVPYNGTIERIAWCVVQEIAGGDNGSIEVHRSTTLGGAPLLILPGELDIPASSPVNTEGEIFPTASNTLTNSPYDTINFVVVKASLTNGIWGGKVLVSIIINRNI